MVDKRFRLGVAASVAWLLASAVVLVVRRADIASMTPNAWGDFFAGSFAPLAFLWLVLGYLQQGEDLRLSTEALKLQAEELRNSVEQQRALVEVSRQQVESEREALQEERRLRDEETKPTFILETSGGAFRGDGHSTYNIGVANVGNIATAFLITLQDRSGEIHRLYAAPLFDTGQHQVVRVEVNHFNLVDGCILRLRFRDKLARSSTFAYKLSRENEHPHSGLLLQQLEA